ncbi:hypothetical protein SAMN05421810_102274 [Amycolatopsis arida]|uniref:Excreted virulence factor EspC, type VII ESX diderm n=1 Tax=Amycolatopsis arida TaxID=587909 RepID=A0A1I5PFG7_9PSEU|nr:hypothetical protein [Amycolatopsis arida]TDX98482.1 hypothetical protein CLV69_101274 [Amycolatopsis arida]SFP32844.1 hypothetical protein SAMN05421810_102274 [Amycolatopsis arida]
MGADGDSGNSFLQNVLAEGLEPDKVNNFADGAKNILAQAKAGKWAVSEEMGEALFSAIKTAEEKVASIDPRLWNLVQTPKLGNDKYAQQVSQQVLLALDSDDRSLVPTFRTFQEGLGDVRHAIEAAKKNYQMADEESALRLGPLMDGNQ